MNIWLCRFCCFGMFVVSLVMRRWFRCRVICCIVRFVVMSW